MRNFGKLSISFLCFYGLSACASFATGTLRTLSGDNVVIDPDWSAQPKDGGYRFEPVQDGKPSEPRIADHPGVSGARSLEIQVPTDKSGHKERFEYKIAKASDTDGLHFDNARYTRFSFLLASPTAPFLSSSIIFQGWQGYPFGPPISLKIISGAKPPYTIKLAVRNMTTGPDSNIPDHEVWKSAMIEPDTWYTVIVFIEPRYNSNGRLRLWINGHPGVDWHGPIGYDPAKISGAYDGLDIKNGIYQPDINNGHTIYFDKIEFGTDFDSISQ